MQEGDFRKSSSKGTGSQPSACPIEHLLEGKESPLPQVQQNAFPNGAWPDNGTELSGQVTAETP